MPRVGWLIERYDLVAKALAVLLAVVAVILLARALPTEEIVRWLHGILDPLGWWATVVYVLLFIVLTTFLLPGWPLNVVAGAVFGPILGGVMASLGSTSAAAVTFLLGRYFGQSWVADKVHRFPKLHAIHDALGSEAGWKLVAAVRLSHSLPFGLQNLLLGVSPVGFGAYLLTTWLITLPGIFLIAYIGSLADTAVPDHLNPDSPWTWAARILGIALAGAAISYIGRLVYRAVSSHPRLAELKEQQTKNPTSPWPSIAWLSVAVLFLGFAIWCYIDQTQIRTFFQ